MFIFRLILSSLLLVLSISFVQVFASEADEVMQKLYKKYKGNSKKYESLAKKMAQRVDKAIKEHTWSCGADGGEERPLTEHPFLLMVDDLASVALKESSKKNDSEKQALLKKYPWDDVLELVSGLQDGSDRAIPDHENGFINLGDVPDPLPGFPDLMVNAYLYGFDEILSWKYKTKLKKRMTFLGRKKRTDKPEMEECLPAWECIRVYLEGSKPEVPLLAVPWMTHLLHTRLQEKRGTEAGGQTRMDELLAFLDSKWNGFYFDNPYTRKPEAFVRPIHALLTEKGGFVFCFDQAARLSQVGDIPFVSLRAYQSYGISFLDQRVDIRSFIRDTAEAESVRRKFQEESHYIARYKVLIEIMVWAVLAPNLRYPAHLKIFDYPEGDLSKLESRTRDPSLDMPRKHAVLLWAYVGKDPMKLADYLEEALLGKEANRFPNDVFLAGEFTTHARSNERKLIDAVAARIKDERGGEEVLSKNGYRIGDFEREFSPYAEFRTEKGAAYSAYLAASHLAFHNQLAEVIRQAAMECVLEEIGK